MSSRKRLASRSPQALKIANGGNSLTQCGFFDTSISSTRIEKPKPRRITLEEEDFVVASNASAETTSDTMPSSVPPPSTLTQIFPKAKDEITKLDLGQRHSQYEDPENPLTQLLYEMYREEQQKQRLPEDTENQVTIVTDMGVLKLFRRTEIYRSEGNPGKLYRIKEFKLIDSIKHGVCDVAIELKHTFLGEDGANRYAQMRKEDGYDHTMCRMAQSETKPLRSFTGSHLPDDVFARLNPDLVFDKGPKDSKAPGYNLSFQSDPENQKVIELDHKPIALDMFAGGGGMSTGMLQAGIDVQYMIEKDQSAASTLKCNHNRDCVYNETVEDYMGRLALAYPGYDITRGELDILHGSPPCNGFSRANRTGGKDDEANNKLTFEVVKYIKYLLPKLAIMENVVGIFHDGNERYLRKVVADLLAADYQVRITILDSADYGDAQTRNRLILFAAQIPYMLPNVPPPTHGSSDNLLPVASVGSVMDDLEKIEPSHGNGLVIVNGVKVRNHNSEGTQLTEDTEWEPLKRDLPANTVRKGNKFKHYNKNRLLTTRERARLQSFPDEHDFQGSQRQQQNQIGNAVPINLALNVALSVLKSFKISG